MIICEKCFIDEEVKNVIKSLNKVGFCEICGSHTYIYDSDLEETLVPYFTSLLDVYSVESSLDKNYPDEIKFNLIDELKIKWNLFNSSISKETIEHIIKNIVNEYDGLNNLFSNKVSIPELNDEDFLNKNCILKTYSWDDFARTIKSDYRFHSNHMNLSVLNDFLTLISITYNKGEMFFRGRISNENKFSVEEMGAPPCKLASSGRANPDGISYLYLASNKDTTIYETRSGLFDLITIGDFKFYKELSIVDLTSIANIGPFNGLDLVYYYVNKPHLTKMDHEISKPLRRSDSKLDYIPTQYIVEYIKSLNKFNGIKYKSSLTTNGFNIVLFNASDAKCTSTKLYEVDDIKYTYQKKI